MSVIFQYIILPSIVTVTLFLIWVIYVSNKYGRVIAARGGIRNIYAELFEAIKQMPESYICFSDDSTATATYLNHSNKYCKLKIRLIKSTTVVFSIKYKDKWVTTSKKTFEGDFSGSQILWEIIINFPDCDLSDNW